MTEKIKNFLAGQCPDTPCLVVDLDVISSNYRMLQRALPKAEIFYAVKANPAKDILTKLAFLGSSFDAASIQEVEFCLETGVPPHRIAFGNTIKKSRDILGNTRKNLIPTRSRNSL
mgnify:CR=1 FL=1